MANKFSVHTYSPSDLVLTMGGYTVVGWDRVVVTRDQPSFLPVKGIRGKHTRVRSKDTSCSIVVTLIQTSPSNDVFSSILNLDEVRGTGRLGVLVKDMSGRSIFGSNEAYITGFPEVSYSGEFEYRSWTIYCQSTQTYSIAGNSRPQTGLLDAALEGLSGLVGRASGAVSSVIDGIF